MGFEMRRRKSRGRSWKAVVFGGRDRRVCSSALRQRWIILVRLRVKAEDESRFLPLSLQQPPVFRPQCSTESARPAERSQNTLSYTLRPDPRSPFSHSPLSHFRSDEEEEERGWRNGVCRDARGDAKPS
jgi:hypothetical protein